MSFSAFLALVLCNLVWSGNPAAAKIVLEQVSPTTVGLLRYGSAWLVFVAIFLVSRRGFRSSFFIPDTRRDRWLILCMGALPFCFSPILQNMGLAQSRATDTALMVALEPLSAILLAWIVLKEKLHRNHWISLGLAVFGFFLLSGFFFESHDLSGHFFGNVLVLLSLGGEAVYAVVGRMFGSRNLSAASVFGSSLTVGVVFLTITTGFYSHFFMSTTPWDEISHLGLRQVLAVIWLGPLGTTMAYWVWLKVLARASIASSSVVLFVQPLVGALIGQWFLHERLDSLQMLGGALILVGLAVQTCRKNHLA